MSLYKIHALAGKSILCRVYLYMEDLDNTLKYANMVLEEKSTLTSLASMPTDAMQYKEIVCGVFIIRQRVTRLFGCMGDRGCSPVCTRRPIQQ